MSSAIALAESVVPDGFDLGDLLGGVAEPELPCRSRDADLWFAESPAELERAKAFCAGCPVREACLAGALARREPWGVWGGEIFERGAVIARKRPRGRPRKNATLEPAATTTARSAAA
ncbi:MULTISPECIES: WhiB family transcriptional regulator [Amycolatopsis]|uniref:Transcriptional regulator WhiB n=2 Tax=Amycolatopsis TaxID=1813 RepID=A0A2A9F9T5_9PSEU|nr:MULTISPECIES: WhiB family transcriptional regulator [Amycolatopsis]PFG47179.1 WhiB family redox-sensing transcriptional regulator [Amycolatopsis sulphurea]RJQ89311.1 WhiB family transcriptional regulator [Amycolatopsis panacis]